MKLKSIIAAAIMAATATTASAQVFNKDHGKAVFCSLVGENAAVFARGRLLGMPYERMKRAVVDKTTDQVGKTLLSDALLAVYAVENDDFFRVGNRAPEIFSVAATKSCMEMNL